MVKNNKLKVALGLTALGSAFIVDNSFAVPQTFTGSLVPNLYGGNVQVQITVENGIITTITTPVQPTGTNAQFANMAIPTLISEAIVAQSANIQGVSGASAISAAWKSSLASAISNAGSAIGIPAPTPTTNPTVAPTQTPSVNISGNTVCSTAAPTPVSTSTATTTNTIPEPTSTPTSTPSVMPTPTPTKSRESENNEKDLKVTTIINGANSTITTITKTITQNQIITCTTTNTITNTLTTGSTPNPTVTVTAQPVPAPTVTVTATSEPIILKPSPVIKRIVPPTVLKVSLIKCQKGKVIKRYAGKNPKCPIGYKKVK